MVVIKGLVHLLSGKQTRVAKEEAAMGKTRDKIKINKISVLNNKFIFNIPLILNFN